MSTSLTGAIAGRPSTRPEATPGAPRRSRASSQACVSVSRAVGVGPFRRGGAADRDAASGATHNGVRRGSWGSSVRGQGRTTDGAAAATAVESAATGDPGDGTRERILDAAVEVLGEVGYGHFSVQKVARRAGVYQGNITYYWPRRRDLVLALALQVIGEYRSTCLAALDGATASDAGRAEAVVRAMVDEAVQPARVRILPELWSMANTDPEIARAVIRSHDDVLEAMLDALGVDRTDRAGSAAHQVLLLVGAAIQGLTAVHGHRSPDDPLLLLAKDAVVTRHAELIADALERDGA